MYSVTAGLLLAACWDELPAAALDELPAGADEEERVDETFWDAVWELIVWEDPFEDVCAGFLGFKVRIRTMAAITTSTPAITANVISFVFR